MPRYIGAAGCNFMKRLLVIFALLPALALAGTPLALKYDSQTGSTTDIPSSLTKINFPAGFQLQVAGVPIGSSSFSTITGNPSDNANLSAALASKAGASLGINQFAGGAGAYRILSVVAADEIDTRILGLTAGNTAQKLYSSGTTRSTTHFAHAVDLTCVSLQTAGNWQGTVISPRHIVTANHINPANGTTITFVAADGTNVSRTLSNSSRIGSTDIQIGLLSSDLPASIVPARVFSSASQEATVSTGSPLVFVDQAQKIFVGERNTSVESSNSFVIQQAGTSPRSTFWKSGGLVTGDSGGAIGAIIDGVYVAMSEMHTANSSTQLSGDSIARNYAAINSAMTSLGGSYQLTAFKSQVLPAFLIGTQNAPLINSATGAYNLLDSATDSPALTYNSDDAVYTLTAPGQFRTTLSLGTIASTGTSADNKGASYGILASDDDSVVLYYDAAADGWSVGDPSTFRIGLGLGSIATVNQGAVTDAMLASAVKPAVAVVATSNLTLSGEQTLDGITTSGSLVLATAQSTGANNGPWISGSGAWIRPGWFTAGSTTQAPQFLTTFVRLGTVYSGSTWRMTTANVTIGTTATTWVQTPLAMSATSVTGNLPASAFGNVAVADGLSITLTSAATFGINSISGSKISGGTLGATAGTNLTGTAASLTAGNATKWTTGRTIALTGDVTYTSGSLDGSGSVTGAATLTNIPAISGVNLTNLNATNLASGTVATARLGSGTANSTTVLYGDQTYKSISLGLVVGTTTITSGTSGNFLKDVSGVLQERTPAQLLSDIGAQASGSYAASGANSDITSLQSGVGLTSPKITTGINDTNGNTLLGITATTSAVNSLTISNSSTSTLGGTIGAAGTGTNLDITITPKGSGNLNLPGGSLIRASDGTLKMNASVWMNANAATIGLAFGTSFDTLIGRDGAGGVQVNDTNAITSTAHAGYIKALTFIPAGTATTCTGATIGTGSKSNAGFVTATTTGTSTIVITFPVTAPTGWNVSASDSTAVTNMVQTASSTTTATLSGTTVSGDVIRYIAMAY